jgi:hypothetical protein
MQDLGVREEGRDLVGRPHFEFSHSRVGESSHLMEDAPLSQDLYEFAVELRRLAYTMPAGYENPLIHLSERMLRRASEHGR